MQNDKYYILHVHLPEDISQLNPRPAMSVKLANS